MRATLSSERLQCYHFSPVLQEKTWGFVEVEEDDQRPARIWAMSHLVPTSLPCSRQM